MKRINTDIVVIDYGLGNLASVYNALAFLKAKPKISKSPKDIARVDKVVLPGVGAFGDAMMGLEKRNLITPLKEFFSSGKAYLGICLGLQVLFEESEEGNAKGLGIFKGRVKRFRKEDGIKIPHIGWNSLKLSRLWRDPAEVQKKNLHVGKAYSLKLTAGIKDGSYFYFDHSYHAEPEDKDIITATTDYGVNFASMICKDNIYAVQFHPERSQNLGLKLLENFIKL